MSAEESQPQEIQDTPTPGVMLRSAREKLGLSQKQVADKLFLKVKNIDDIENDHIDEATSVTFAKGYVRIYAKHVGLNDQVVIGEFEKLHTSTKPPAKLQSFSRRVAKQAHDDRWMMVTWVILLLLLAAFVGWWYQQSDDNPFSDSVSLLGEESSLSPAKSEKDADEAPDMGGEDNNREPLTQLEEPDVAGEQPQAVQTAQNDNILASAAKDTLPSQPQNNSPAATATQPSSVQSDAPITDNEAAEQSTPETSSETPSVPSDNVELVFRFEEDCWVNIEDATGEAIAYGVKSAGRVMPVKGQPPFSVTLGAPDGVNITYAGENVDISSMQNGRTARFTLPM